MPYCKECGAENEEGSKFCQKCGKPLQSVGVVYRKDPVMHGSRILALIFGGFILLVAIGLVAGGGLLVWSQTAITNREGYMITNPVSLSVGSYAIVQNNINIHIDNGWWMNSSNQNIVSLKIIATSNTPKPIFVGVVSQQSALNYFNGVNIDRLISYNWVPSTAVGSRQPVYQTIPGGPPSTPPTSQIIWAAQASGSGTQTMTWTPTTGDYWIVVMNADGSKNVDANVQVGARVTILSWIGWGLIIGGLLVALVGVVVIYFGYIRYR
jgi:hypothetical protein